MLRWRLSLRNSNGKEPTDLLLAPNDLNGLKKASLVRLSKLATIHSGLVQGRLGTLDSDQLQLVHKNLRVLFQL
jgi:mRNA interferase MazF